MTPNTATEKEARAAQQSPTRRRQPLAHAASAKAVSTKFTGSFYAVEKASKNVFLLTFTNGLLTAKTDTGFNTVTGGSPPGANDLALSLWLTS